MTENRTERPKGKWIIVDDCEQFIAKCSVCGRIEDSRMVKDYPFCHCGADMRKDAELNFAITYIKPNPEGKEETKMKDKIKQAVADEFKYRASQGRTNYSMEEVIYIVNEVIDEVAFENK